jgi:hypothetical protein
MLEQERISFGDAVGDMRPRLERSPSSGSALLASLL